MMYKEIKKLKKAKMQVVKVLLLSVAFCMLYSCQTKKRILPTYNDGGYIIESLGRANDKIELSGTVTDQKSKLKLENAIVKIGCYDAKSDKNGFYKFSFKNVDQIYVSAVMIGYKSVETKVLSLNRNTVLKIDFILQPDDRPIYNCEGLSK